MGPGIHLSFGREGSMFFFMLFFDPIYLVYTFKSAVWVNYVTQMLQVEQTGLFKFFL